MLQSCSTPKNAIYWVSGVKTECSAGAGKMQCLNVFKGEDLANATWQNFYSPIEGFSFEEGYFQKIEVKETKLDPSEVPADASTIKYKLIQVLDKKEDNRANLNNDWTLVKLNGAPLNRMVKAPTMNIDLSKKMISGNGGCNNFSGKIKSVTTTNITIDGLRFTKKACFNKNVEVEFQNALNTVVTYTLENDTVSFFDENGTNVLTFIKKKPVTYNQRLHDIWVTTKIEGGPLNRMVKAPRLEINLTEMRIMGNDGCNSFTGTIQNISETNIQFGPIAGTKKMCPKMETANKFNAALQKVKGYTLDKLTLTFVDENGNEMLSFLKVD